MNEPLENPAAGPSADAAGLSDDFKVMFSPETGESLVWFEDGKAARLREDGTWIVGNAALPTPYELMEYFERVRDSDRAAVLLHEARAALASGRTPTTSAPGGTGERAGRNASQGEATVAGGLSVNHPMQSSDIAEILEAADFAAQKHQTQRRKDAEQTPYINHPLRVAAILAGSGVRDIPTLVAALLHDTIEDTGTKPDEIEKLFGAEVRSLVQEVTDDKTLPKAERKRLQVEHAPHLSPKARLIKLADKITNVTDLSASAPVGWPVERKVAYLDWAEKVVAGMRGSDAALERLFDQAVAEKRSFFSRLEGSGGTGAGAVSAHPGSKL